MLLALLLLVTNMLYAQEHVYVTTDNLVLRDRPELRYAVLAILHAPCRLQVDAYDSYYANNKAVKEKFYRVSMSYEENGIHNYIAGWVVKKYVRSELPGNDAPGDRNIFADKVFVSAHYDDESSTELFNATDYPAPKYKGGEPQHRAKAVKRAYHKGPRGGCYYINGKGHKIYVDSKYCAGKGGAVK